MKLPLNSTGFLGGWGCNGATRLDDKTWVVDGSLELESLAVMEDRDRRAKVILISAERA